MPPEEGHERAMGIGLMVGVLVMDPVHRYPACWGVLHGAHTQKRQESLKPLRCGHAPVGQHAVVANVDSQRSEDIKSQDAQDDSCPTEEPGDKGEASEQVNQRDGNGIAPTHLHRLDRLLRSWQGLAGVSRQDFGRASRRGGGSANGRGIGVGCVTIGRLMDRHGHPEFR